MDLLDHHRIDIQAMFTHMAMPFVICNMLYYLFAFSDIISWSVFYNLRVDSLSRLMSDCSRHGDDRTAYRTAVPRYDKFGIPGRHNGRRAGKRGRARPPSFRNSCHRKHRPNIHDVPVEEPPKAPPEFPPRRLARHKLGLARWKLTDRHRLQKLRNLHYFLDPDKDNPISSTDEPIQFFLPQIDFSWWQLVYSIFVKCFHNDTINCDIKSPLQIPGVDG